MCFVQIFLELVDHTSHGTFSTMDLHHWSMCIQHAGITPLLPPHLPPDALYAAAMQVTSAPNQDTHTSTGMSYPAFVCALCILVHSHRGPAQERVEEVASKMVVAAQVALEEQGRLEAAAVIQASARGRKKAVPIVQLPLCVEAVASGEVGSSGEASLPWESGEANGSPGPSSGAELPWGTPRTTSKTQLVAVEEGVPWEMQQEGAQLPWTTRRAKATSSDTIMSKAAPTGTTTSGIQCNG